MTTQQDLSIAIVGGGIGGLCTAIALRELGITNIAIYESKSKFGEIGAGVSLGPNASRALKRVSSAAFAGFERVKTTNASPDRQTSWFAFRRGDSQGTGEELFKIYCPTGQTTVARWEFLHELEKLIPPDIAHFNKNLSRVYDRGSHVTLRFSDNTSATHGCIIACDGIHSIVRKQLLGPEYDPTFSGKYALRGLIPMPVATDTMNPDLAQNSQLYLGLGAHLLTFPVSQGHRMNVVGFATQEGGVWPDPDNWVINEGNMELFWKDFEGWIKPVQQILGMVEETGKGAGRWGLYDHPPAPYYFRNRICLLGDAAHAATPHNGAGAGMAIEDALIMAHCIKSCRGQSDFVRAFDVFDHMRRERTQRLVETSRRNGHLYDLELEGIGEDMDKVQEDLKGSRAWIWDWDAEREIKEVERLMKGEEKRDEGGGVEEEELGREDQGQGVGILTRADPPAEEPKKKSLRSLWGKVKLKNKPKL